MNRLSTVLLLSATIASLFGLNDTKKFCDAFEANNYTISYGYRNIIKNDGGQYHLYVFIDQSYWKLNFTDNKDIEKQKVGFISLDSQESNWFGDKYSIALCIHPDNKDDNCTTYLADFKRDVWDYTTLKDKNNSLTLNGKVSNVKAIKIKENQIVFVPSWNKIDNKQIIVFDQSNSSVKYYQMNGSQPIGNTYKPSDASVDHDWLTYLNQTTKVVAILGQYSYANQASGKGDGVVILFKSQIALQYCYSQTHNLSDSCKRGKLKTLINCPKITTKPTQSTNEETIDGTSEMTNENSTETTTKSSTERTTKKTTEKTTKSSTQMTTQKKSVDNDTDFMAIIVLGGMVLLIVILLIIIISCLYCCGKSKKKIIKGVKPSKKDQFSQLDQFKGQSGMDDNKESKSEMFSVKSSVDYTKPIPINSSTSVQPSTESIARPTDLNVRPKPK